MSDNDNDNDKLAELKQRAEGVGYTWHKPVRMVDTIRMTVYEISKSSLRNHAHFIWHIEDKHQGIEFDVGLQAAEDIISAAERRQSKRFNCVCDVKRHYTPKAEAAQVKVGEVFERLPESKMEDSGNDTA